MPVTLQSETMAGDSNYDVWFMYDNWTLGAVEYLLPWEELPYINLDRDMVGDPSATEVFNLEGEDVRRRRQLQSLGSLPRVRLRGFQQGHIQ